MADGNYHVATAPLAIEVNRISRYFGSTCAVADLSFAVRPGQVMGFIGPNGAGKTTTMRILATLDEPDLGDAVVDGFSVVDDPDRVRFRLGFMPDIYGAYPWLSCIEYLDFFARSYGLTGMDRADAIRRAVRFTHMEEMLDKPMNGLSKGMKQRLCLSRALIHDPAVLILDEPAAGLDPRARIELKEMIAGLAEAGKSLLISSHILTELAEMCDEVLIIERGQLRAAGSVESILAGAQSGPVGDQRQAVVEIEVLEGEDRLVRWLAERPGVAAGPARDGRVEVTMVDDPAARQQLLAAMVGDGFAVHRFASRRKSLEEVFLQVTEGKVQ